MKLKSSTRTIVMVCVIACLLLALNGTTGISSASPGILHVKPSATGSGDCSDWDNACTLQTALGLAGAGDEIWVAAGTHKPTDGMDRTATFQLKNGVALYGGFEGNETSRDERDLTLHETILSGDIGTVGDMDDNSFHVVTGSGTDGTAVLDGFTITSGNADGIAPYERGGGMYNGNNSSPTLSEVTLKGNYAAYEGGGMYNGNNSSPTLTNVTFSGNSAIKAGGMCNFYSSPTLANVSFSGNSAEYGGGGMCNIYSSPTLTNVNLTGNFAGTYGGGASNEGGSPTLTNVIFSGNDATEGGGGMANINSSPTLTNVTFSGNSTGRWGGGIFNFHSSPTLVNSTFGSNSASFDGGGMYNYDHSSPTLTNVTLTGNFAGTYGGGMYNYDHSSPTLSEVTFSGNSASVNGGGMYNEYDSSPTLTNVIFMGNHSDSLGGGMLNQSNSSPTLTKVAFSHNSAFEGGGMSNLDSSPRLTEVTFSGNSATAMSNRGGSPTLINVIFSGNSGNWGGGMWNYESSPTLVNVTFSGNQAEGPGGGMCNIDSSATLDNITFTGNSSGYAGGGMSNLDSNLTLDNVTFSGNSGYYSGGGMYNDGGSLTLTNSILWGNTAPPYGEPQISNVIGTNPTISHSLVEGSRGSGRPWDDDLGTDGGGNIDADPQFVDADGADDVVGTPDDNVRLGGTSPAIDAGDNDAVPPDTLDLDGDGDTAEKLPWDLDGYPRIVNGTVDMGGFEAQQEVFIDIKPGRYPNSINLSSDGVVSVAVLTTENFDASTVDPETVLFAGAPPVHSTMEDVDHDRDMDLLFHFKTQELNLDENSTEAMLECYTYGGQFIWSVDTVNIVP